MGDVIDLNSKIKEKCNKDTAEKRASLEAKITILADDVLSRWGAAAQVDQLNDFIVTELNVKDKNYIDSLDALAKLEKELQLGLAIFHPGMSPMSDGGYSAAIRTNTTLISTPIMVSEEYARAFALVFYNEMVNSGLIEQAHYDGY